MSINNEHEDLGQELKQGLGQEPDHELEHFADPDVASYNKPIPKFLIWTYILLPIWGIITAYFFWNGSLGWFDRGYWKELQIAANTTFPIENQNMPKTIESKVEEDLPRR